MGITHTSAVNRSARPLSLFPAALSTTTKSVASANTGICSINSLASVKPFTGKGLPISLIQVLADCWGSASTRHTFFFFLLSQQARCSERVVLPDPPFWLKIAIMLITQLSYSTQLLKCPAQVIELSIQLK